MAYDATDTTIPKGAAKERILKELHERWIYATDQWRDIREEAKIDMRYVAGDPWGDKERKAREAAGRPIITADELSQYLNQAINDVRQNKRAVEVTPVGTGANDKSAEFRGNLIRQIEYRSNAQQQAYLPGFENEINRGYGFWRVKSKWVPGKWEQELWIEGFPNPDLVTPDPDGLKPDGADWRYCFVRESYSHEEFKRKWPKATMTSFEPTDIENAKGWIDGKRVWVAEYWTLEVAKRTLLLIEANGQQLSIYQDEIPKGQDYTILQQRDEEDVKVCQYVTNGLEILSKTPWPGKTIPIVPAYGKILWVDEGAGSKRKILSMVRLARDPYMLYCYYRTTQAELVGMTPKTPFVGYVGQFRSRSDEWGKANHQPQAYLEADPTTEATGPNILPLPQRQPYDPPIERLEIGAESARRAIQAAMGTNFLPTQAQRRNEKSGVALKEIGETAQKGSFHFVDHYDAAITRTGAIIDEVAPFFYDTLRDVAVRTAEDTTELVTINDPNQPNSPQVQPGAHDVTLSTGPSYDSERELASEFADLLVQNPLLLQTAGPKVTAAILGLAIKLKNVGPLGTKMAEWITPPEFAEKQQDIPPQVVAQMQQLEGALQQAKQFIETKGIEAARDAQLEQVRQAAETERFQVEQQTKLQIAEMQANTQFGVAEIKANVEDYKMRLAHIEELMGHQAEARQLEQEQAGAAQQLQANQAQERELAEADRQFQREEGDKGRQQERELTAAQLQAQRDAKQSEAQA
jgi:hypothetical protein